MPAVESFDRALTDTEHEQISALTSPPAVQAFLDGMEYSGDPFYRCPLRVLRDRKAHCFDGALFASAALRRLGYPPLILDMLPNDRDDDHLLALFQRNGHWGAVAKSNFVGLRFRESVYRSLRELVMSYFEQFYNVARERTLRGYTCPFNLQAFDGLDWMTSDEPLERIAQRLDRIRRYDLLTPEMVAGLSLLDARSHAAGLLGVNEAGLYRPPNQDG
jgi:hypothetical protein